MTAQDSDSEEGMYIIKDLSVADLLFLGYGAIILFCLLLCMLPCTPLHKRCKKTEYAVTSLETYNNIIKKRGYDPLARTSLKDERPIGRMLLRHDLTSNKVLWFNDYYKDYYLYMRMNHPFLAIFYSHEDHPYSLKERIWAFIGIQFIATGFAVFNLYVTTQFSLSFNFNGFDEFIFAFIIDLFFGIFISLFELLLEFSATCSCAENTNKKCRHCLKGFGHCGMILLIIFSLIFFIFWLYFLIHVRDNGSIESGVGVFFTNYFIGLFSISWFFIDFISLTISFTNEWHRQRGEPAKYCTCINSLCIVMWCCCCGVCYMCCCRKRINKNKENKLNEYPKDSDNDVIGSRDSVFAVTWKDYKAYVENKPIPVRSIENIIKDSILTKITTTTTSQIEAHDNNQPAPGVEITIQ